MSSKNLKLRKSVCLASVSLVTIAIQLSTASSWGEVIVSRAYGIVNYQSDTIARSSGISNFAGDIISRPVGIFSSANNVVSRATSISNFGADAVSRGVAIKNCAFGDINCGGLTDADCNDNGVFDLCDVACDHTAGFCDPGCGMEEDCNLNGIPDDCEGPPGSVICAPLDCNGNGISDSVETHVHIQFSLPYTLTAGLDPYNIGAGDLDNDGDADLVIVNVSGNNCSLYRNDGGGVFVSIGIVTVGASPRSVAIGDFDGDTRNDLAVACFNSNSVSILRNLGNWSFATHASYAAGPGPQCVVAGDLDNNGRLDLVVADTGMATNTNTVAVLWNNGSGAFNELDLHTVGIKPRAVTLLDIDHDSLLDIASADSDPDTVTILRNIGGGNFTTTGSYPVQRFPFAIAAADWDGDAHPDLAVLNSVAGTMSLLRNDGDGQFAAMGAPLPTDNAPRSVQPIDVDGDGAMDILLANYLSSTISLYHNTGDGTFEPRLTLAFPANSGCTAVAVADFDSDGRPDAAVANRTVGTGSILFNDSTSDVPDCNHNGVPDSCDVSEGTSGDVNSNGVPDECETSILCVTCRGDVSSDDVVDGVDIQLFVECFLESSIAGHCVCADMGGDGQVSSADIPVLAAKLLAGSGCP